MELGLDANTFFFLVNMVYWYTQIEWYNLTVSLMRWKFFSYCVFVLTSCKYQVLLFGQILCSLMTAPIASVL